MRFNEFKLFEANLSFGDFHQAAEERWDVFLNRVKGKIPWDGTIAPTLGGQEYDYPKARSGTYPYNIYIGYANATSQSKLLKSIQSGSFYGYLDGKSWVVPVYDPKTNTQLDNYRISNLFKDHQFAEPHRIKSKDQIANFGNLTESLAGAGLTAKFTKRVQGGVQPIEVKDILKIISKLTVDNSSSQEVKINSKELHKEDVVYASAEYKSNLQDKIVWRIKTQEQAFRELVAIGEGKHLDNPKLLGLLGAVANYANSRLMTQYSRFFATNLKVDEIIVDTDGIGGAASLQSGGGTKADLFIVANGKKLRYANLSLKATNPDIGQQALVGKPQGNLTAEKLKDHLWNNLITLWKGFDDGTNYINVENILSKEEYLNSIGITSDMDSNQIEKAINSQLQASQKKVRPGIQKMFSAVANNIKQIWLKNDDSQSEYDFIQALVNFVEYHAAREDNVELVDFKATGDYSVHSFKNLYKLLKDIDFDVGEYKTNAGNVGFKVYDINNPKDVLVSLYFQPRAGQSTYKLAVKKGPLLKKVTNVSHKRNK